LIHTCAGATCIDRTFADLGTTAIVEVVGNIANIHRGLNCFLDLGLIRRDVIDWTVAKEAGKCTACQRQESQIVSTHGQGI
jgi:hypothetical protein